MGRLGQEARTGAGGPRKAPRDAVKITRDGVSAADTNVVGMSILQAGSTDEALSLVVGHHHLEWSNDCEIVLLEEMAIPELQ